jgi:phage/plasmid primase-like uncharacterized protein
MPRQRKVAFKESGTGVNTVLVSLKVPVPVNNTRQCAGCGYEISHGTKRPQGSTDPLCAQCRAAADTAPAAVSVPEVTMQELATQINTAVAEDEKRFQKEKMEQELRGKKASSKPQRSHGGMFEKTQLTLF